MLTMCAVFVRFGSLLGILHLIGPCHPLFIHPAIATPLAASVSIAPSAYPQARRDESVVDDYHGKKVHDPYQSLEDPDSPETKAFIDQLNNVTTPFLAACDIRDQIRMRLTELWNHEKYGCTVKHGQHYFYTYNSGLQNQSVIYIQESLSVEGKLFLDPNLFSEDGTTSISQKVWSQDGTIMAYGLSEKGSDWMKIRFLQSPSAEDLKDVISGVKASSIAFLNDNSGVFYSTFQDQKGDMQGSSTKKSQFHALYFHKIGTNQSADVLCAEFRDDANNLISADVSEDGSLLIVNVRKGFSSNRLYYFDLHAADNIITGRLNLQPLFEKADAKYIFVGNIDDDLLILTDHNAPMFKLIWVNRKDLDETKWKTVVPENKKNKLDQVELVAGDKLLLFYLENVKDTVYVHNLKTGTRLYKLQLDIGTVTGFFGKQSMDEMFFTFESFFTPTIVYRLDFNQSDRPQLMELHRVVLQNFRSSAFEVKQVFYPSKDGTKIPMYLLRKKSLGQTVGHPTVLYGYGGFNIAITPAFSLSRLLQLQHLNITIAIANIRGGSEYGARWHETGMRHKKQNVFDDFIAAAEYLIKHNHTSVSHLCIEGGSNGGLLVAVCAQQRPDLFGAVINKVGVMDMLRFPKFTIGAAWMPEFGNPDNATDFQSIYAYSPLHNLRLPSSGQWPAMLLMTADHDDRVVPLHSLKYMAQLYYTVKDNSKQTNPLLIRVEVNAGHGSGKPTTKVIEELVDVDSFLVRIFDLQWTN